MGAAWSAVEEAGECIRNVVCCLMCLPCIGLIVAVVGVSILATLGDNTRVEEIDQWNDAKQSWTDTHSTAFSYPGMLLDVTKQGVAVANKQEVSLSTAQDPVRDHHKKGDPEWLAYNPTKYQTSPITITQLSQTPMSINYKIYNQNKTLWSVDVPSVRTTEKSSSQFNCYTSRASASSDCRERGEHSSHKYCRCDDACYDSGGQWSGSGGSVYHGTCSYSHLLTQVCIRVDDQGKIARNSRSTSDEGGCQYDHNRWAIGAYDTASSRDISTAAVPVFVRSANDPYVELSALTKGQLDFGMSEEEKARMGMFLLVGGLVFLVLPCCAVCTIMCCVSRNRNKDLSMFSRV